MTFADRIAIALAIYLACGGLIMAWFMGWVGPRLRDTGAEWIAASRKPGVGRSER
jgi:hypothetical protein